MRVDLARIIKTGDFQYGVCLIGFGVAGVFLASPLRAGTAIRMGPGFVPTGLAWLVTGVGLIYTIKAIFQPKDDSTRWGYREIGLVLGSIFFFRLAIDRLGLLVAIAGLSLISSVAEYENQNWKESVSLAAGLAIFCWLLFAVALGLPIQIIPVFLQ